MKTARVLAAIAVALALQTTLARFAIGGDTVVDLVLVVVVYAALAGGPITGLLAGTAGGLILLVALLLFSLMLVTGLPLSGLSGLVRKDSSPEKVRERIKEKLAPRETWEEEPPPRQAPEALVSAARASDLLVVAYGPFVHKPLARTTPEDWRLVSLACLALPGIIVVGSEIMRADRELESGVSGEIRRLQAFAKYSF